MSPSPKISVLMPVFNAARYLPAAVESILAQTFADFEFIIVDDGSTDRSPAILKRFAQRDARIKIVSRPNTGIVGALNDGLTVARGEFIARMDADDLSRPERLATQLCYLETHPELVAIGSSVLMVDPAGRPLKEFQAQTNSQWLRRWLIEATDIGIIHPSLMVRRSTLERLGGYRERYKLVEDIDLFLRLLDEGELGNTPETLLEYRQHPASTNATRFNIQRDLMARCIAEHRQRWNLPALEKSASHPPMDGKGAQHTLWAYWAMEGNHPWIALYHAAIACLQSSLAPEARQCFNYVLPYLIPFMQPVANNDIPVVLVHNGPSQVIVTACAAQARAAGCKHVFVISDRIGPWALIPGVHPFAFSNADNFGAREFRASFVNYSSYSDSYAAVTFERFFAMRALMAKYSLDRILHLDSDLLLFTPATELATIYPGDFTGTDIPADNHESVSPHCLLMTQKVCNRICSELLTAYGTPEGHERLQALWKHKKEMHPEWGVSDMDFLAIARDCGDFKYNRVNQGNPCVDVCLQDTEGFKPLHGAKDIAFENGKPYGVLEATGERVFFYALHMQGYIKHLAIHHAQLSWFTKRFLYLLLKLESRGWLKWPKARTTPAS